MKKRTVVLCIMDGFAISNKTVGNAIHHAKKPNLDALFSAYPPLLLQASGLAVGLPDHQIGNSEVGHMNIGAGRVVYQSLTFLHEKMRQGDFSKNPAFQSVFDRCIQQGTPLHLIGLLSDGGVHSHQDHVWGLLELAKQKGVKQTFVHVLLDGRDVDPQAGKESIARLLQKMHHLQYGEIATISGRYYAMDRDKNFARLDLAYQSIVQGKGLSFTDPLDYVLHDYAMQKSLGKLPSDEFILPAYNIQIDGQIKDRDGVIFVNFRPDRAIQLATVLTNPTYYREFGYVPATQLKEVLLTTMMSYAASVKAEVAYDLEELANPLGVYLAKQELRQLRIAETEKYAHVTFFFDGTVNYDGVNQPALVGCDRILVPSPKVATYDLQPQMSAYEITRRLIKLIQQNVYDVIILNFANCDMVGHTSNFEATIKAVETVDACVGMIYEQLSKKEGLLILTSDHGNADCLVDDQGNPVTAHTTNPVPFVICDDRYEFVEKDGKLGDIAPTILRLMELSIPEEMTGNVLARKKKVVIETDRLVIRAFEKSDLEDFYRYCSVPGVGEAAGWKHHETMAESKKILDDFITSSEQYAIVLKTNQEVIGSIGIMQGQYPLGEKEIGYVLAKDYWNQGFATEAVKSMIHYYFSDMKGKIMWVSHALDNIRSCRVIEKNHFHYMGTMQRTLRSLQETRTSKVYRLTKKEYEAKRN